MKKSILSFLLLLVFFSQVKAQPLHVEACHTDQEVIDLVDSVLLGNFAPEQKANIIFNGDPRSVGYYRNGYLFGFSHDVGMVMTSGFAEYADNGNECGTEANASNINIGGNEDPDLEMLGGGSVHDACIVEFDVFLLADSMSLNYVFGSEEYHEYVDFAFNDVFGFFLSGNGISGIYSNNSDLLNKVSQSVQFVSVQAVNFGNGGITCSVPPTGCTNCQYLIDNSQPSDYGFLQVVYDAYTVPMQGTHYVKSGNWYHVKLSISDIGDSYFDSGVFLEKNFLKLFYITSRHENTSSGLKVYPNPATDILNVEFATVGGTWNIVLEDLQGNAHAIETVKGRKYSLSVKDLPRGLYILKITGDDFIKQIKVVLK